MLVLFFLKIQFCFSHPGKWEFRGRHTQLLTSFGEFQRVAKSLS
jgi:hypothetical protein